MKKNYLSPTALAIYSLCAILIFFISILNFHYFPERKSQLHDKAHRTLTNVEDKIHDQIENYQNFIEPRYYGNLIEKKCINDSDYLNVIKYNLSNNLKVDDITDSLYDDGFINKLNQEDFVFEINQRDFIFYKQIKCPENDSCVEDKKPKPDTIHKCIKINLVGKIKFKDFFENLTQNEIFHSVLLLDSHNTIYSDNDVRIRNVLKERVDTVGTKTQEVLLNNRSHIIYYKPIQIEGKRYFLAGIISKSSQARFIQKVGFPYVFILTLLSLIILLVIPATKIFAINSWERLSIWDYRMSSIGIIVTIFFVLLGGLGITHLNKLSKVDDEALDKWSAALSNEFISEIKNVINDLKKLDKAYIINCLDTNKECSEDGKYLEFLFHEILISKNNTKTCLIKLYFPFERIIEINFEVNNLMKMVYQEPFKENNRDYVHCYDNNESYKLSDNDSVRFYVESVFSFSRNEQEGIVSFKSGKNDTIWAASLDFKSVMMYKPPKGFGYCVVTKNGDVVFNSINSRNNFKNVKTALTNQTFIDEGLRNKKLVKGNFTFGKNIYKGVLRPIDQIRNEHNDHPLYILTYSDISKNHWLVGMSVISIGIMFLTIVIVLFLISLILISVFKFDLFKNLISLLEPKHSKTKNSVAAILGALLFNIILLCMIFFKIHDFLNIINVFLFSTIVYIFLLYVILTFTINSVSKASKRIYNLFIFSVILTLVVVPTTLMYNATSTFIKSALYSELKIDHKNENIKGNQKRKKDYKEYIPCNKEFFNKLVEVNVEYDRDSIECDTGSVDYKIILLELNSTKYKLKHLFITERFNLVNSLMTNINHSVFSDIYEVNPNWIFENKNLKYKAAFKDQIKLLDIAFYIIFFLLIGAVIKIFTNKMYFNFERLLSNKVSVKNPFDKIETSNYVVKHSESNASRKFILLVTNKTFGLLQTIRKYVNNSDSDIKNAANIIEINSFELPGENELKAKIGSLNQDKINIVLLVDWFPKHISKHQVQRLYDLYQVTQSPMSVNAVFVFVSSYDTTQILHQVYNMKHELSDSEDLEKFRYTEINLIERMSEVFLPLHQIDQSTDRLNNGQFYAVWAGLSDAEKFILVDLAKDGLLNPKNKKSVQLLHQKGIIHKGYHYHKFEFFNSEFKDFILEKIPAEEIQQIKRITKKMGRWAGIRLALTVLFVVLIFLVWTVNPNVVQKSISTIGVIAAGIAATFQVISSMNPARLFAKLKTKNK
ncbi:MAG: hypothetical protein JJU02_12415 [Cryomorphaceae bacterium]|nr:hypothetical protein [Cryomorphaceae bacterium]